MFQTWGSSLGLYRLSLWMAQATVDRAVDTPERAALVFSGPRFFIALIAGVVLAFAFQLVLTNLSVALGISILEGKLKPAAATDSATNTDNTNKTGSVGGTIRKIETAVGLWTLVTVSLALLVACFLAVKLSLITEWGLGAIVGLVIWGTYYSLLVWAGSNTVSGLIGSLVNVATSGFQSILGTATAAIGAKAASSQMVATAEAAAAAIRREFTSGLDPTSLRETVEDYIQALRPPDIDIKGIRREFEKILSDPQIKEIASSGDITNIDRQKLVELVSSRTDLSKRDVNRIVDQLEAVWKETVGQVKPAQQDWMKELVNYLKSAQPEQIRQELSGKFDQLIAEIGSIKSGENKQDTAKGSQSLIQQAIQYGLNTITGGGNQQDESQDSPNLINQAIMLALNTTVATVMGRTDLSELDVEKILEQVRSAKDKLTGKAEKIVSQVKNETPQPPYSTIRADVENYLLNTYSWKINRENLTREFKDVLFDPQADPSTVRQELEHLSKSDFTQILQQRGGFTAEKIKEIAEGLESIRQEVLKSVLTAEAQEKVRDVRMRVEAHLLLSKKEDLTPENIKSDFQDILSDDDADVDTLQARFSQFDSDTLAQILKQREDLTESEIEAIVKNIQSTRSSVVTSAQNLATQAKAQAETVWLNVESYLRNTGKEELNPEEIQRDIKMLLEDPTAGISAIRARLSRFDRDTLVQLLNQREDLSEAQINQIIDQVQETWNSILASPKTAASIVKEQYEQVSSAIAQYLRNTGKEELNPEGIKRDLTKLLNDPKAGSLALRDRLSMMDRDTLVKLLSQRQDLSEEQVNQVIDRVQETIRTISGAPRRLAARTQAQVQDFKATLEDYLRNTGKEELNPEAIKRDLQLLLHDPRVGMESLGDRLSKIDRDTLISLLSQRQDMSSEEAAKIVDQVLSVRDSFVEQVRAVQRRIQLAIDSVFDRIRNYLNSLDRPELNYDGIKQDLRKLFDDPQAGFDSLRDRLSQFNRDTLVAIISSRDDISEADANRLINQVERTRDNVLQRAERLQQEAQRRLDEIKHQAQEQAEETRKVAASAAWWLFGTAVCSSLTATLGGILAVVVG